MKWEERWRYEEEVDHLNSEERNGRIRAYVRAGWQIEFIENGTRTFDLYSPDGAVYADHVLFMNQCSYCYSDNDICYHDEQLLMQEAEAQRLCLLLKSFPLLDENGDFAPSLEERVKKLLR